MSSVVDLKKLYLNLNNRKFTEEFLNFYLKNS